MKHFGLTLQLKNDPALMKQYRAYHREPWPEPLQGLKEVGVEGMHIFLLGTRMFMHMAIAAVEAWGSDCGIGLRDAIARSSGHNARGHHPMCLWLYCCLWRLSRH